MAKKPLKLFETARRFQQCMVEREKAEEYSAEGLPLENRQVYTYISGAWCKPSKLQCSESVQ